MEISTSTVHVFISPKNNMLKDTYTFTLEVDKAGLINASPTISITDTFTLNM